MRVCGACREYTLSYSLLAVNSGVVTNRLQQTRTRNRVVRLPFVLPIALWIVLLGVSGNCAAAQPDWLQYEAEVPSFSQKLVRVQNLVRANVLELAQEILETEGPTLKGPKLQSSKQWLQWERQLWALYQARGQWQKLYRRVQRLPSNLPPLVQQEVQLQAINALTALQKGSAARDLIRQLMVSDDVSGEHPQQIKRQLRQAIISAYLADGLLPEARIAVDSFYKDYGSSETDWLLLSAGILIQSGDPSAAVNRLAPLQQPAAQLLRLYARLSDQTLTPEQVIELARKLLVTPQGQPLLREIHAVIAQANRNASHLQAFANSLEEYLLTTTARNPQLFRLYPQFTIQDLVDAYTTIAQQQANADGLVVGDEANWLEYAQAMSPDSTIVRKSFFAYLAKGAKNQAVRQQASDAYVDVLIETEQTDLIDQLFGEQAVLGKLTLGGATGLRLSAYALEKNNFRLAADANANLSELPADTDRADWLLQAGRVDIFAGRYQQGGTRLNEWIESFRSITEQQTITVLQPIFDLQTVQQHQLALPLLHKVRERATKNKHRREIAYWLAESYDDIGQHRLAADLFLHSALQQADGLDPWGEAARFRATEALMNHNLFDDAKNLLEEMLGRARDENWRSVLRERLQQLLLLQSSLNSPQNDQ